MPYFSASSLFPFDPAPWTIFQSYPGNTATYSITRQAIGHNPATPTSRRHTNPDSWQQANPATHVPLARQTYDIETIPSLQGTPFTPASFQLPSAAWHWTSPWSIIMGNEGTTDEHGWEYNWIFRNNGWKSRLSKLGWAGYVRRRKWIRAREYQEPMEDEL